MLLTIKSCSLDNYEKPNAILFGSFIDQETGELIEQDIINGTKITVIEHGFETPQEQYLVVKNDGTYRNTMIGLYVDPEPSVGEYKRVFAKEIPIGMQVDSSELLTIEIDLNTVSELKSGKSYYFRIGALLNVPEAKSNYAKAVKIQI